MSAMKHAMKERKIWGSHDTGSAFKSRYVSCRDHIMRAQGWKVVNIPFFEYRLTMSRVEKVCNLESQVSALWAT